MWQALTNPVTLLGLTKRIVQQREVVARYRQVLVMATRLLAEEGILARTTVHPVSDARRLQAVQDLDDVLGIHPRRSLPEAEHITQHTWL